TATAIRTATAGTPAANRVCRYPPSRRERSAGGSPLSRQGQGPSGTGNLVSPSPVRGRALGGGVRMQEALRRQVDRALRPRGVAVVGASRTPSMITTMLHNIRDYGFEGDCCAVNPRYLDVDGIPCYP